MIDPMFITIVVLDTFLLICFVLGMLGCFWVDQSVTKCDICSHPTKNFTIIVHDHSDYDKTMTCCSL